MHIPWLRFDWENSWSRLWVKMITIYCSVIMIQGYLSYQFDLQHTDEVNNSVLLTRMREWGDKSRNEGGMKEISNKIQGERIQ